MSFKRAIIQGTMEESGTAASLPPLGQAVLRVATEGLIGCMLSSPMRSTRRFRLCVSATATKIRAAVCCKVSTPCNHH